MADQNAENTQTGGNAGETKTETTTTTTTENGGGGESSGDTGSETSKEG